MRRPLTRMLVSVVILHALAWLIWGNLRLHLDADACALFGWPVSMAFARQVAIALVLILLLSALGIIATTTVAIDEAFAARKRKPTVRCPVCGYDLRATPLRCPECGHVPSKVQRFYLTARPGDIMR